MPLAASASAGAFLLRIKASWPWAAERALALGGVQRLRHDSPTGRLALLTDPQGGRFGVIERV